MYQHLLNLVVAVTLPGTFSFSCHNGRISPAESSCAGRAGGAPAALACCVWRRHSLSVCAAPAAVSRAQPDNVVTDASASLAVGYHLAGCPAPWRAANTITQCSRPASHAAAFTECCCRAAALALLHGHGWSLPLVLNVCSPV